MQKAVQDGQGKIERIMTIRNDTETTSLIGKRLHEIVDNCLQIDISAAAINAGAMGATKRQKLENDENQRQFEMRSTQMIS